MRIVVAGGSGLLGESLSTACVAAGDEVVVLSRRARPAREGVSTAVWDPGGDPAAWAGVLDGADALVNLAGTSIAGGRWSNRRKVEIWDSRLQTTRALAKAMGLVAAPPAHVVSGSAVGYYGSRGDEVLTEDAAPGSDFLARLCVAWEQAGQGMTSERTSVACIRTGLVLARDGGALPRMALPFKLGAGGVVGDGSQYMSWIHLDDWVRLVRHLLAHAASAAWNLTAPNPVTNAEFTRALGKTLRRPTLVPAPAFALRLALGEMADALLLASQRVMPAQALAAGFEFRYPTIETALAAIYGSSHQEPATT
jgi:uncharacterized protein (TIGR01777 family)